MENGDGVGTKIKLSSTASEAIPPEQASPLLTEHQQEAVVEAESVTEIKPDKAAIPLTGLKVGEIHIEVFDGALPIIKFVGELKGKHVGFAMRKVPREYHRWKATIRKTEDKAKIRIGACDDTQ